MATIDDVRFTAIPKIRNIEKAKLIIEENSDLKTLEDLASYNEITVNKALALNQKSATIADAGFEPLVVGHAFALPENEESDFIVGQNGVYKIRVIKKDSSMDLESYRAYKNQLIQSKRPTSTNSLYLALKENAEKIIRAAIETANDDDFHNNEVMEYNRRKNFIENTSLSERIKTQSDLLKLNKNIERFN